MFASASRAMFLFRKKAIPGPKPIQAVSICTRLTGYLGIGTEYARVCIKEPSCSGDIVGWRRGGKIITSYRTHTIVELIVAGGRIDPKQNLRPNGKIVLYKPGCPRSEFEIEIGISLLEIKPHIGYV
jgi:hypothetical protein